MGLGADYIAHDGSDLPIAPAAMSSTPRRSGRPRSCIGRPRMATPRRRCRITFSTRRTSRWASCAAASARDGVGVEGSWFHGREPDEHRTDIDLGALDRMRAALSVDAAAMERPGVRRAAEAA